MREINCFNRVLTLSLKGSEKGSSWSVGEVPVDRLRKNHASRANRRALRICASTIRRIGRRKAAGAIYRDGTSVWVAQTNRPLITETASDSPSNIPHLRVRRRHSIPWLCSPSHSLSLSLSLSLLFVRSYAASSSLPLPLPRLDWVDGGEQRERTAGYSGGEDGTRG